MRAFGVVCALVATSAGAAVPAPQGAPYAYPPAFEQDHFDEYRGSAGPVQVADPYRWMEDSDTPLTRLWITQENELTFPYLDQLPTRNAIRDRLTSLYQYERMSLPEKVAGRYFFRRNSGTQNQSVLYDAATLDGPAHVLIDPNTMSEDGTIALDACIVSPDGKTIAYALQDKGTDWRRWRTRNVATGEDFGEEILWSKYGDAVAWSADNRGYFYTRFPRPNSDEEINLNQSVYYHRLGTPQAEDVLIYARPENPDWYVSMSLTKDRQTLVIQASATDERTAVLVKPVGSGFAEPAREIIAPVPRVNYGFLGESGGRLLFQTNGGAPNSKIISLDPTSPAPANWATVVPEAAEAINGSALLEHRAGDQIVVHYLRDAHSYVRSFRADGRWIRDLEFPEKLVTVSGLGGISRDGEAFYSYESFVSPPSIYRYDIQSGESTLIYRAKVDFDSSQYETRQVFYPSKDGTKVPMFITAKKGTPLDGSRPTILWGYGGFSVSYTPVLSPYILAWIERGGVYALANLRGGNEYGDTWHRAGTKLQKQNVFDDFIAAGEYLVREKVTSPRKLAIRGGSNGGLLVGAVVLQRPDLFGAAIPQVGVMDMLRFNKFSSGRFWVDDYGSPEPLPGQAAAEWDAREFDNLLRISPYHEAMRQRGQGISYPATLVTTSDHDDRVVPMHSFKFAAALQAAQAGPAPIMIRIEVNAGHGSGLPLAKKILGSADEMAFIENALGVIGTGAGEKR